jgi:hypothetical protein
MKDIASRIIAGGFFLPQASGFKACSLKLVA